MPDRIVKKLYQQAIDKVAVELKDEQARRVHEYLMRALRALVDQGVITSEEATREGAKYGVRFTHSSSGRKYTPSSYPSTGGCGGQSTSTGNRC